MKWDLGKDVLFIHLTLIPYLSTSGELKTKPTQHSVKTLLEYGIQPDILVCRTEHHLDEDLRKKIALFCNVEKECVIESIDAKSIYEVPLLMFKEKLDAVVCQKLALDFSKKPDLLKWNNLNTLQGFVKLIYIESVLVIIFPFIFYLLSRSSINFFKIE